MVMRWKILELAENASDAGELVDKMLDSGHFDADREELWRILDMYRLLLPETIQLELSLGRDQPRSLADAERENSASVDPVTLSAWEALESAYSTLITDDPMLADLMEHLEYSISGLATGGGDAPGSSAEDLDQILADIDQSINEQLDLRRANPDTPTNSERHQAYLNLKKAVKRFERDYLLFSN